ncbi:MAG TPA: ABC transporter substrate-binding protein, partial [Chloroflexota bacterium]
AGDKDSLSLPGGSGGEWPPDWIERDGVRALLVFGALVIAACTPGGAANQGAAKSAPAVPNRVLSIAVRTEGESLAAKALSNAGINIIPSTPFNAGLVYHDAADVPHAELASELPQLNSDTWRVLPDGRMETTYRLKPNLAWHDGQPLTAEDFGFAFRVYSTPALGTAASSTPINQIEQVVAVDVGTILMRWKSAFADAGDLQAGKFQALPRHLLEEPFANLAPDAFAAHPFWTAQYVGLGPYRVTRWDRGVFLEAEAFDRFVRGRPRIDRIKVMAIPDPNVVLTNLLAGDVQATDSAALSFEQGWTLKKEWESQAAGTVEFNRGSIRRQENQFHPERANPAAILDIRVRRALAHTMDKQSISDALFQGLDAHADTLPNPALDYYSEIDRSLTKYPFDPTRSEQLMREAGYSRGTDGFFQSSTEGKLNFETEILSGSENEAVMSIMASTWRKAGFEITETVLPAAMVSDRELRAHFRTMFTSDTGDLPALGTAGIPTPGNRWTGSNRGSWSNPTYDGIVARWEGNLDRAERNGLMVDLARIYSEDLPSTPIYYRVTATPHHACLTGPSDGVADLHLWQWTC